MLRLSIAIGESGRIASVIFVFVWFGLLAWTLTSCAFTRSEVTELLSLTPEYQCLKKERGRNPYVSWDGRRYLKPHYGNGTATGGGAVFERWLGKSGQRVKWSFCLKAAKMAAEQEIR